MMKNKNLAEIYDCYVDDMYTYALYLGFNEYDVMDAIHDVFFKLCEKEGSLKDIANLKFYLFKSLRNRLINIARKDKKELCFNNLVDFEYLFSKLKDTVENKFIEKEEEKKIQDKITEMLCLLSPRQKEIIYLRYIQECDYNQIAEIMSMDYNNCRKLVYKAIQVLRKNYPFPTLFFISCMFTPLT